MSYGEVMNIPIRAFWLMNGCVGRLLAEKDLRAITVQQSRHGGEAATQVRQHLEIEMGTTGRVKEEVNPLLAERDQTGFEELKALAALM